jgi:hypothetical protein
MAGTQDCLVALACRGLHRRVAVWMGPVSRKGPCLATVLAVSKQVSPGAPLQKPSCGNPGQRFDSLTGVLPFRQGEAVESSLVALSGEWNHALLN